MKGQNNTPEREELIKNIARKYLPRDFVYQDGLDLRGADELITLFEQAYKNRVIEAVDSVRWAHRSVRDGIKEAINKVFEPQE